MVAAIIIAFFSSIVVFWQTGRILPLFDYTYQIENAYRIAVGQVPYRDFILITTPFMHTALALLMKIFGFSSFAPLLYMTLVSFLVVMATYWVLTYLRVGRGMQILFLLPLLFAAHGIVPLPSYDVTATLLVLLGVGWIMKFILFRRHNIPASIGAGILLILPALAKQNVGIMFIIATYITLLGLLIMYPKSISRQTILYITFGSFLVGGLFIFLLGTSNALIPFIRQNRFVLENRNPTQYGLAIARDVVYWKNILIYLPVVIALYAVRFFRNVFIRTIILSSAVLFTFIFIPSLYFHFIFQQTAYTELYFKLQVAVRYFFSVWYLLLIATLATIIRTAIKREDCSKNDLVILFAQIILGCTTISALFAQGVGGSTFGIYPFFVLLLAGLYRYGKKTYQRLSWESVFVVALLSTSLFLMIFTYSNIRQSYIPVSGKVLPFKTVSLWHLATPGTWTSEVDRMFHTTKQIIPQDESTVALPGEDPFYFVTGRKPRLRYFELFSGALPYAPERIAHDIMVNNINWLIIKTHLQSPYYMDTRPIITNLSHCFVLAKEIPGYSFYRKYRLCDRK